MELLALGEAKESRVLRELGRTQNPQNAHSLLLDLGYWERQIESRFLQTLGVQLSAQKPICQNSWEETAWT